MDEDTSLTITTDGSGQRRFRMTFNQKSVEMVIEKRHMVSLANHLTSSVCEGQMLIIEALSVEEST